jgi:LysR family transcriptional activator of nhaA
MGQELLEVLDGKSDGKLKDFKIGIADVVPKSLAYRLIAPAFLPNSGFVVSCLEDKTENLLVDLSTGAIDIVVADRPIPPNLKVKAYNHLVGQSGVSFLAVPAMAKKLRKNFPYSLEGSPMLIPTREAALRQELDQWFDKIGVYPSIVANFQDRALMKIAAKEGHGIIPIPTVVSDRVSKENSLQLIGKTEEVKERLFLISIERKLKSPLHVKICAEGQKKLFS